MSLLASTQRKKALDLEAQAEALLNKRSWFGGKERNQEDAAELYGQAANAYKVGGFGHEAGTTYSKAGAIYRDQVKNPSEASKCYSQAGTCCVWRVRASWETRGVYYWGEVHERNACHCIADDSETRRKLPAWRVLIVPPLVDRNSLSKHTVVHGQS
jgi:Soluble NSF attachment protein, SNAP